MWREVQPSWQTRSWRHLDLFENVVKYKNHMIAPCPQPHSHLPQFISFVQVDVESFVHLSESSATPITDLEEGLRLKARACRRDQLLPVPLAGVSLVSPLFVLLSSHHRSRFISRPNLRLSAHTQVPLTLPLPSRLGLKPTPSRPHRSSTTYTVQSGHTLYTTVDN